MLAVWLGSISPASVLCGPAQIPVRFAATFTVFLPSCFPDIVGAETRREVVDEAVIQLETKRDVVDEDWS